MKTTFQLINWNVKADEQLKLHKPKFKRDKDQETKYFYSNISQKFFVCWHKLKSGKSITQRTTKEEINTKF